MTALEGTTVTFTSIVAEEVATSQNASKSSSTEKLDLVITMLAERLTVIEIDDLVASDLSQFYISSTWKSKLLLDTGFNISKAFLY